MSGIRADAASSDKNWLVSLFHQEICRAHRFSELNLFAHKISYVFMTNFTFDYITNLLRYGKCDISEKKQETGISIVIE